MAKRTKNVKVHVLVKPRTITMPDGRLRMFRVYSLDGIEAIPTWVTDPDEPVNRLRVTIPFDYPKTKLADTIDRLRRSIKKLPADPRRANIDIAVYVRAVDLVSSGHLSRKTFRNLIARPEFSAPPLVAPLTLQHQRRSRLIAEVASAPRNRSSRVSVEAWKAIRRKWAELKPNNWLLADRLPLLDRWYDANRHRWEGPPMEGSRLQRYAQSATYPHKT